MAWCISGKPTSKVTRSRSMASSMAAGSNARITITVLPAPLRHQSGGARHLRGGDRRHAVHRSGGPARRRELRPAGVGRGAGGPAGVDPLDEIVRLLRKILTPQKHRMATETQNLETFSVLLWISVSLWCSCVLQVG